MIGMVEKLSRTVPPSPRLLWLVGCEMCAAHYLHLDINNYPPIEQQVFAFNNDNQYLCISAVNELLRPDRKRPLLQSTRPNSQDCRRNSRWDIARGLRSFYDPASGTD